MTRFFFVRCPRKLIRILSFSTLLVIGSQPVFAASFTVTSGTDTAAKTLGSGAGQTGSVSSGATLAVSGSTVAVTVSGNSATLTNLGTITQTGTGRVIRDNTGVTGLVVTNGSVTNSAALMKAADADVIQMNVANGGVTLNNYGTMTSLNASNAGSQAVDFNAIVTGSNIVNNFSTGFLLASEADAVRPGVNGVINNYGTIKATTTTGSSSDGIDAQTNTGVSVTNFGTGLIEGARHGITGGNVLIGVNSGAYTMNVTNNSGGVIKGDNGAGINIDGINKNEVVTVINGGTITGNGVTGDGDGIDVDGLINLTNTGVIRSINSFSATTPAQSEGVTVGGGTIVNSGTIEGLVAAGNANAVGRGITIAGIDTSGTPEPIYSATTITNQSGGLIRGQSDSGIAVGGATSGFTVTVNNNAGATIQGGGVTNAAVLTGADNDTINNAGTIDGSSSGKAIEMGAGNNTLNITGGSATILGSISGGTAGTNALTIDPGAGHTFSYNGVILNFATVEIKSGSVKLFGASQYTGTTTVSGGLLFAKNVSGSATGSGLVTVKNLAGLTGDGRFGGNVNVEAGGFIAPGDGTGTLKITGNLNLVPSARLLFELGSNAATSDLLTIDGMLNFSGIGSAVFDFTNNGVGVGTYKLLDFGNASVVDLSNYSIGAHDGFSAILTKDSTSLSLVVTAIPEPSITAALLGLLVFSGVISSRVRSRKTGALPL